MNNFLSTVLWRETLIFMALRCIVASIPFLILVSVRQGFEVMDILAAPFAVFTLASFAFGAALLSKIGIPFAGFLSILLAIPLYIGDPIIWLIHKMKPDLIPLENPSVFNPPLVWVVKRIDS
ncbi:MAG: hypothetical protein ABL857_07440 [Rickettsiales bacterium]|jgi:hypothetical protein